MKYAIVEDGGKQYKAVEGEAIEVDRFQAEIGEQVDLDRVLLISDGENISVGTPYLEGVTISATVEDHNPCTSQLSRTVWPCRHSLAMQHRPFNLRPSCAQGSIRLQPLKGRSPGTERRCA